MEEAKNKYLWKTVAMYVYASICIFDFLIMPAYTIYTNRAFSEDVLGIIDESNRKYALEIIDRLKQKNWEPVTVYGGGMIFHLSFGAILTGAALSDRRLVVRAGLEDADDDKK